MRSKRRSRLCQGRLSSANIAYDCFRLCSPRCCCLGTTVELLIDNRTRIEQLPSSKVELQIIRGKEDQVKIFLQEKTGQKRVLPDED